MCWLVPSLELAGPALAPVLSPLQTPPSESGHAAASLCPRGRRWRCTRQAWVFLTENINFIDIQVWGGQETPRWGAQCAMLGRTGKHQGWAGAEEARRKCGPEPLLGFLREGLDEAESEGQRWPVGWLHQAPGPWGRTPVVWYLAGRDQGRGSVAQSVRAP